MKEKKDKFYCLFWTKEAREEYAISKNEKDTFLGTEIDLGEDSKGYRYLWGDCVLFRRKDDAIRYCKIYKKGDFEIRMVTLTYKD